jgi:hypothetical protein
MGNGNIIEKALAGAMELLILGNVERTKNSIRKGAAEESSAGKLRATPLPQGAQGSQGRTQCGLRLA